MADLMVHKSCATQIIPIVQSLDNTVSVNNKRLYQLYKISKTVEVPCGGCHSSLKLLLEHSSQHCLKFNIYIIVMWSLVMSLGSCDFLMMSLHVYNTSNAYINLT